jgi:serine acetyltransferase
VLLGIFIPRKDFRALPTSVARRSTVPRLPATGLQAAREAPSAPAKPGDTLFCYSDLLAATNCRLVYESRALGVSLTPRMFPEHAHGITGVGFHPSATSGHGFSINHDTRVVMGEARVIKNRLGAS